MRAGPARLVAVWAALLVATLLSVLACGGEHPARAAVALSLALAFIKARYVALEFIGVRGAPPWLRRSVEGWVLVVGAAVLLLRLVG